MADDNFKILGYKDFGEMDLPSILYKYRDWDNPNHKRVLTENELYLASPADFEDEFDCKVPVRYDLLTEREIYLRYLNSSIEENPTFSRQQHRKYARYWQRKGLLRDKCRLAELDKDFFEKFNQIFGILSLTANSHSIPMWDYYAAQHSGFCVGFHTLTLCNLSNYIGGGGIMKYYDEFPIIKVTDKVEKKHFLQIHSKLRKWEFEDEYRLTKINIKDRQVKISNNVFAEIIFGANMPTPVKNSIIEIVSERLPNVNILEAFIENDLVITRELAK